MLNLKISFNKNRKERIIMASTLLALFVLGIVFFVIGSFYKYDLGWSHTFYKGMQYPIFKGWSSYVIMDGFNILVEFCIALVCICGESIYLHWKNVKGKTTNATKNTCLVAMYVIVIIAFFFFMAVLIPGTYWKDQGFGVGFAIEFIAGWDYLIPEYIVSVLVNTAIGAYLLWYVHYRLARQQNFLSEKYWQKSLVAVIYIFLTYVVTLILKTGFGRPDPFRIYWNEHLGNIQKEYPDRWQHYMDQSTFNQGWNDATGRKDLSYPDQDWSWWVCGSGWFNKGTETYAHMNQSDGDFPSGHFNELGILIYISLVMFSGRHNKISEKSERWFFWVLIFWWFNMLFAMLVGQGHWISDMGFSMVWDGLCIPLATLIFMGINKTISAFKR